MDLGVKNRVALVFGAAGGLGRAAEPLAQEGRRLRACGRQQGQPGAWEDGTAQEVAARSAADIPIGCDRRPEEYARVVTFLANVQPSYVTGSLIRVVGGLIPSV